MRIKHSPFQPIVLCLGMISFVWRARIAAPLRPGSRRTSPSCVACRCFAELFGKDQKLPAVGLSGYSAMEQQRRASVLGHLDAELQEHSVASLVFADLNHVAEDTLATFRQDFADRMYFNDESDWSRGGEGWLWPQSAEMYSHPHYLAFVNDDGTTTPSNVPAGMQKLLDGIQQEAVPVLEDLLGLGMNTGVGSFAGKLRMRKVIVHYYPSPTAQETLLTHAAFHTDDSFLTLNFESPAAMHGLHGGIDGTPEIRRLCHSDLGSDDGVVNLFVGGYLQSLSRGRWHSFIHSGSNMSPGDRVSITVFLGIPSVDSYAGGHYGGTRGQQESAVHSLLQEMHSGNHLGDAAARFAEIRSMYSSGGKLPIPYGSGACDTSAASRRYSVVGSWSEWATFNTLLREDSGKHSALSNPCYHVSIPVPAGEPVEFQLLCDEDWQRRIFPSKVAGELLGPCEEGHGSNFCLDAPDTPAVLNISWNPTGRGKLEYGFTAMEENSMR